MNPRMIAKIKTLVRALNIDHQTYEDMLTGYGVSSSKELNIPQAIDFIEKLEKEAISMGVWQSTFTKHGKKKYDNLVGRPEYMAAPSKLRKIEAMWQKVSYLRDAGARQEGLYRFISRITGKHLLTALHDQDANKVIAALNAMIRSKQSKNQRRKQHEPQTD